MAYHVRVAGDGDCFFSAVAFSLVNSERNACAQEGWATLVLQIAQQLSRLNKPSPEEKNNNYVGYISKCLRSLVAWKMLDPFDEMVCKYRAGLESMHREGVLDIGDVASDYFWVRNAVDSNGMIANHLLYATLMNRSLYQGDDMTIQLLQRVLLIAIVGINPAGAPIETSETVSHLSSGVVFVLKIGSHYDACYVSTPNLVFFPLMSDAQMHYTNLIHGLGMLEKTHRLRLGSN